MHFRIDASSNCTLASLGEEWLQAAQERHSYKRAVSFP
jgi:hypothetical protein